MVTPLQLFGYGIAFIGVMYYNYQKIQVRSTGWGVQYMGMFVGFMYYYNHQNIQVRSTGWGALAWGGRRFGCQQVRSSGYCLDEQHMIRECMNGRRPSESGGCIGSPLCALTCAALACVNCRCRV